MTGVTVQHPHPSTASAPGPARTPRRLVGLAGAVVLLFVRTGCLQHNVQMSVRKDDTVSGRILVAGDQLAESTDLDRLSPPSGLEQKVRITPYTADGFSGREIYFTQLTFAEVDTLAQAVDIEGARPYTMSFRRSGDTVAFTGSVDLSGIPEDRAESASTRVDLTFPNRITETNGSLGGGNDDEDGELPAATLVN